MSELVKKYFEGMAWASLVVRDGDFGNPILQGHLEAAAQHLESRTSDTQVQTEGVDLDALEKAIDALLESEGFRTAHAELPGDIRARIKGIIAKYRASTSPQPEWIDVTVGSIYDLDQTKRYKFFFNEIVFNPSIGRWDSADGGNSADFVSGMIHAALSSDMQPFQVLSIPNVPKRVTFDITMEGDGKCGWLTSAETEPITTDAGFRGGDRVRVVVEEIK